MFLRTRNVRFTINEEDHKEVERGDVLANRFFAQGTEIAGNILLVKIYTHTLCPKLNSPIRNSVNFNKTFPAFVSKQ